jgi:hypothetical protein
MWKSNADRHDNRSGAGSMKMKWQAGLLAALLAAAEFRHWRLGTAVRGWRGGGGGGRPRWPVAIRSTRSMGGEDRARDLQGVCGGGARPEIFHPDSQSQQPARGRGGRGGRPQHHFRRPLRTAFGRADVRARAATSRKPTRAGAPARTGSTAFISPTPAIPTPAPGAITRRWA